MWATSDCAVKNLIFCCIFFSRWVQSGIKFFGFFHNQNNWRTNISKMASIESHGFRLSHSRIGRYMWRICWLKPIGKSFIEWNCFICVHHINQQNICWCRKKKYHLALSISLQHDTYTRFHRILSFRSFVIQMDICIGTHHCDKYRPQCACGVRKTAKYYKHPLSTMCLAQWDSFIFLNYFWTLIWTIIIIIWRAVLCFYF